MNKNNKEFLILLVIIVFLYLAYVFIYDGTVKFSDITYDKEYNVRNTSYKELSVRKLATINARLSALIEALRISPLYSSNSKIERLVSRWDSGITIKEIGNMESDAAYVLNKKHMAFCLHNTPDPLKSNEHNLEDDNLLAYAAIHELAHIMSDEVGHGPEFIENFRILLNFSKNVTYFDKYENKEIPIYIELSKYSNTPGSYCGVGIENTME
jgi:hypothetical protein